MTRTVKKIISSFGAEVLLLIFLLSACGFVKAEAEIVVAAVDNVSDVETTTDSFWSTANLSKILDGLLSPSEQQSFEDFKWVEQTKKIAQEVTSVDEAQTAVDDVESQIKMYLAIEGAVSGSENDRTKMVIAGVTQEIQLLRAQKVLLQDLLKLRYSTPIKPNNKNLQVSAFRASDTFPKIPFYIPGTREIGEFLVVPRVSDDGYLQYHISFLDLTATNVKRDAIVIEHRNIKSFIDGLLKINEWTEVARENGITRRVEKTSACVPEGYCEEKKQGRSSTEVVFQVYEDGSTSGRIQRNKGRFSEGYNMSVESSILLSAYMIYMRDVGSKEFSVGVMTDDEIEDLFE